MNKDVHEKYDGKLFKWCLSKCHNYLDAEDLKQDIYLQLIKAENQGILINNFEHFIWKVAYFTWCKKVKEYLNNKRIVMITEDMENYLSSDIDILKLVEASEVKEILNSNINNLSKQEQIIVNLYYYEGYSIKEIAIKKNMKESLVKYYLYQVRKILRRNMDEKL